MDQPPPSSPGRRAARAALAGQLAADQHGVVHRAQLRAEGITRDDVRAEVRAGRWRLAGRHTVVVDGSVPRGRGRWWWAVWESGSGACLDGVTALQAAGLTGFESPTIHVTVPRQSAPHRLIGVRLHRRRDLGRLAGAGMPRTPPEWATIHAAQWAATDRQAALVVCLAVQQRLVAPARLLDAWATVRRSPRRALLASVIVDVCAGAHSLGELDFAFWCRRYGLPEPTRQSVRTGPSGRVYLDVWWEAHRLVVEIDGAQHVSGLGPVEDALRANEVVLADDRVLRLPLLGLRLYPDAFMSQVARALGRVPHKVMPNARHTSRLA